MSESEATSEFDRGRSDHDPVTGLFLAMRDAWLAIAANESMGAQFTAGRNPGQANPGEAAGADLPPDDQQNSVAADVMLPMGQAMMIAANRSASYWLNLARLLGNYQAKSLQGLGAAGAGASAPGAERLVAVDELRGLLRDVGDLATREARLLQDELGILAESIAQSVQPSDQSRPYRRR